METAIDQSTPATEQGFSATEAAAPATDMQQAMRQEHSDTAPSVDASQSDGLYAGKYQSVEALVDGYKNLQSSFDSRYGGFTGSPENDYAYTPHADLANSEYKIDNSSDSMQRFNSLAKELNMSQDAYNHVLNIFTNEMNAQGSQKAQSSEAAEQETYDSYIKDLGGNEEAIHRQTEDMIIKLGRIPGMEDSGIESLIENMNDSNAFTAMQQVLSQLDYSTVPGASGMSAGLSESDLMTQYKSVLEMPEGRLKELEKGRIDKLYEQQFPGMCSM